MVKKGYGVYDRKGEKNTTEFFIKVIKWKEIKLIINWN